MRTITFMTSALKLKQIGETNSAIELLKQCGADPMLASQKWTKLYPKFCTDMESELCQVDVFDRDYYKGKITSLKLITTPLDDVSTCET